MFINIDKMSLKFMLNDRATGIVKTVLEKNKVGRIIPFGFKTYSKATIKKTTCY